MQILLLFIREIAFRDKKYKDSSQNVISKITEFYLNSHYIAKPQRFILEI